MSETTDGDRAAAWYEAGQELWSAAASVDEAHETLKGVDDPAFRDGLTELRLKIERRAEEAERRGDEEKERRP